MRSIDHAGVYLLIAGTYTPVGLLALDGAWSWAILGTVWSGYRFLVTRDWEAEKFHAEFALAAENRVLAIRREIDDNLSALNALRGHCYLPHDIEHAACPGVRADGVAARGDTAFRVAREYHADRSTSVPSASTSGLQAVSTHRSSSFPDGDFQGVFHLDSHILRFFPFTTSDQAASTVARSSS